MDAWTRWQRSCNFCFATDTQIKGGHDAEGGLVVLDTSSVMASGSEDHRTERFGGGNVV